MAIIALNSFRFDTQGWSHTNTNRTVGAGQNGIASIRATLGADAAAIYGFASKTEVITGFCFRFTNVTSGQAYFLKFANSGGSDLTTFTVQPDGALIAWRGNQAAELGRTLPGYFNNSVELYVEIRLKCSSTVGEVEIRLNGNPTPALLVTGVNTGSGSVEQLKFHTNAVGTRDHSAWYLLDVTGGAPFNTFLGHVRYAALLPTAEGATTGWTPLSGTDNALMVDDDGSQDGDATYDSAGNVGDTDTYVTGNIPTPSSSILAVVPVLHAKKSDAGVRAIKHVIRRSGTDYPGAVDQYLGSTYTAYRDPVLTDPSTAAAWTDAGIDAMEVGLKVSV